MKAALLLLTFVALACSF
jgi:hypothetical protein